MEKRNRTDGTEFSGKVKQRAKMHVGQYFHGVCPYCEKRATAEVISGNVGQVDHIVCGKFRHFAERFNLEFDSIDNAIYVCRKCNNVKSIVEAQIDANDFDAFVNLIWNRYAPKKWTDIVTRETFRSTKAATAKKGITAKRVIHTQTKTLDRMTQDGSKWTDQEAKILNPEWKAIAGNRADNRRKQRGNKRLYNR